MDDIIDELVGQKRFHAHVAKNSLQIILRQLKLEEKNNRFEKNRLKEILKIDFPFGILFTYQNHGD